MAQFDQLPRELRQWLATAILPWSAKSVLKHWKSALLRAGGDKGRACALLSELEARCIARDASLIWGACHPAATPANTARRPSPRAMR